MHQQHRRTLTADHRAEAGAVNDDSSIGVVGEAADGHKAITVAVRERPDVVLMDVRMPRRDGLSATRELLARSPRARVVVLTTFDDDDYLDEALRAGVAPGRFVVAGSRSGNRIGRPPAAAMVSSAAAIPW